MTIITNAGLASIAGLINGIETNAFEYIALGSDNTAESVTQTSLISENTTNGAERTLGTTSRITTNVSNDTSKIENTFSITGNVTVNEIGLFNELTNGDMLIRKVTSQPKYLEDGDTIEVIITIINKETV